MATRIVSWSSDDYITSPNLSKAPSVMSFDSILSDKLVVVGHYFVWHARVLPNVDTQGTDEEEI